MTPEERAAAETAAEIALSDAAPFAVADAEGCILAVSSFSPNADDAAACFSTGDGPAERWGPAVLLRREQVRSLHAFLGERLALWDAAIPPTTPGSPT